jgi:hypothetical protein
MNLGGGNGRTYCAGCSRSPTRSSQPRRIPWRHVSQQAVDDPVLAALLEVLEAALQKITRVRVRIRKREMDEGFCKHGLLALEGRVDAERRRIGIGVDETRAIGRSAAPTRAL